MKADRFTGVVKMVIRGCIFSAVFVSLLAGGAGRMTAQAAATGSISGIVKDATSNLPITAFSIAVAAYNSGSGALLTTTCSNPATGQYTLAALPLGTPLKILADGGGYNFSVAACPQSAYGYEYWNNVPIWDAASPITLNTLHPTQTGVNFTLSTAVPLVEFMVFNFDNSSSTHDFLDDIAVRQAIAYGTDRQTLLDNHWAPNGQYGAVLDSYVAGNAFNAATHADGVPAYAYNASQAQTILTDDGWIVNPSTGYREKGGFELDLSYKTTTYPVRQATGTDFVSQMQAIGIKVTPLYLDSGTFFGSSGPLATGNFDIAEYAYTECASVEDQVCVPFVAFNTNNGSNNGHYSSSVVDSDYANAQSAATPADRRNWASLHQTHVMGDVPVLPLFTRLEGSISGVVKKTDGTPLTGLSIQVDAVDTTGSNPTVATTCTNSANGYYTLPYLAAGKSIAVYASGSQNCGSDSSFYGWTYWSNSGDVSDISNATPILLSATTPSVGGINLTLGEGVPGIEYLVFNLDGTHAISADPVVRQAIAYGTNRLHILDAAWLPSGEYGTVENSYVADNHWAVATTANSALPTYPFNPTQAATLLDGDGWLLNPITGYREKGGNTLSLTFKTTTKTAREASGAIFVQEMHDIGIQVIPTYIDGGTFFGPTGPLTTRDFDVAEYTTSFCRSTLDETCVPSSMYHNGDSFNTADYNSAAAETEYAAFQASTTHADRLTHALAHQVIAMTDLPYLPLFTRVAPLTISGNAGVGAATITWKDGTLKHKAASITGVYSITVPFDWSGMITPTKAGQIFTPASRTYTKLTSNRTAQNYTAHKLVTVSYPSVAVSDGWILETGENTNAGGAMNAAATTFNLGDDAARKQYRAVLSFNTGALPDNAVITGVNLKLSRQSITGGGNPFATFQGLLIDVRKGFFGVSSNLEAADFQAAASVSALGPYIPAPVGALYSVNLPGTAFASINKAAASGGVTQLRLRFKLDDNNNAIANFISFFSGNVVTAASRPTLVVTYYLP